ncbi:MAG: ECF transporter S component [Chloroflexi bacterium RBG_16_56_8]|nr:MAG: ECF transporter S component [Chloroflexi bacterium RBG_16_56_8]
MQPVLSVRKIVITGVLAAIAILLGYTRLGFIPVPNLAGNATIMHVPAIIGGVLEGSLVGSLIGGIFGIFSFLQATTPVFKNPIVAILPRLLIGIAAYFTYVGLKRWNEYAALAASGIVGSLTNTVFVLGIAGLFGLIPWAAMPPIIPQAIAEAIIAAIITVAVVGAWRGIESGVGRGSKKV